MNVLLSMPRSGNTFTRYCIEWLTQRPTLGCNLASSGIDKPIHLRTSIPIKNHTPIITKCHSVKEAKCCIETDKLITLIRNPSQAFGSCSRRSTKFNPKKWIENYLNILKFYDEYNYEKILIYYEDMIQKTLVFVTVLTNFLNVEDKNRASLFVKDIKKHKEKASKAYHTKLISKNDISMYSDEKFKKFNNEIKKSPYFKYIRRYYDKHICTN
jgi:hypothetical protein